MHHQVQPRYDRHHIRRALGGIILDTIHNELRDPRRDLFFQLVRRSTRHRDGQTKFVLLGYQCRGVLSGQGPVHRRPEVKDVRFGAEGSALDLFGSDIVRCSLNPRLDGADLTALAQVDDLDRAGLTDQNIIGFHIAMDKSMLVHRVQAAGNHPEYQQNVSQAQSGTFLKAFSVEILHRKQHFSDLEHTAYFSQLIAFSDVRVVDMPGDLVFGLDLFENSRVLRLFENDPFESHFHVIFFVGGQINGTAGASSETLNDRKTAHIEYIFSHIIIIIPRTYSSKDSKPQPFKMRRKGPLFDHCVYLTIKTLLV